MATSGRALNRTRSKCPTPRLIYIRRFPLNRNSPEVYRRFFTGSIGGGKNGGLHCPPCVCPARIHPWHFDHTGRSAASGLWHSTNEGPFSALSKAPAGLK